MTEPETTVAALCNAGLTLSCAESCTGGLIGKLITDVPGASRVFNGGCITYTNEVKIKLLNVSPDSISAHTEVSREVSEEMADGVRLACGSDIGVSTTGYAGPGGGTAENPVGTVYITATDGQTVLRERMSVSRELTRSEIRSLAANHALALVTALVGSRERG